jgi:archaellum component FlaC
MKKKVQNLKVEIKSLKKALNEVKLEMNNLGSKIKSQRQFSTTEYKR